MGFAEKEIEKQAAAIAQPIVASLGMEIVDAEFRREQSGWVLRFYIDRPGGVTLDDCSSVSREVGMAIEVADLIDHPYHLEVSSPGLTRPLKKREDFDRFRGKAAKIKCFAPIGGRKTFAGILDGIEGETLSILVEGKRVVIDLDNIAKANLEYTQEG